MTDGREPMAPTLNFLSIADTSSALAQRGVSSTGPRAEANASAVRAKPHRNRCGSLSNEFQISDLKSPTDDQRPPTNDLPPMAERKNTDFDRPGGYAAPKGSTQVHRKAARELNDTVIRLFGDTTEPHDPKPLPKLKPAFSAKDPETRLYIGDCRDILPALPECGEVDLIFADPPFNWDVPYAGHEEALKTKSNGDVIVESKSKSGGWNDALPRRDYERFTFDWLDACLDCLAPHGSIFVNVPDDIAAECVMHLKRRGLVMINWCIWHFRFGQNRDSSFIMSKVHVLYFAKDADPKDWKGRDGSITRGRIWNPDAILELSDRAAIYGDPRTMSKETNKGLRVPMDVWYGKYWGRIQGNNRERRANHHNQIPEVYLERVIRAASNPGDLVLDPFCGSGTTSTVARALGRRSITVEYSPVNAKSAWQRITEVGMIQRDKGDAGPQSSAIFKKRGSARAAEKK